MKNSDSVVLAFRSADGDHRTVGMVIREFVGMQPDRPAIMSTGYPPLSYRQLGDLIDRVRVALRQRGLDRSARIAVAIPNGPLAALAIVGVASSATSIPVNPKQTYHEIEVCFGALRPDALLLVKGEESTARRVAEASGMTIIEIEPEQSALGFKIDGPQTEAAIEPGGTDEPDPDAPIFILQSSGTTSEPKLIPFSHRNMLAAAARLRAWFDLTPQDCCLSISPLFYSHGIKVTVFTPLLTGGTVAFPADATKFDFLEFFRFLKPTWYSAGPTLHRLIFDQTQYRADAATAHSLRFVLSGGAPLPRNVLEGLQETLGVPVVEHYGSSEAAQTAANVPAPGRTKLGTCGIPWPGTMRIVNDDGRELPAGEQGEILLGGPTLTSGYLNSPELNRSCFVDGWFKTGDLGSLDEDGFLTLHGRKHDLINRGGEKISPAEIDDALQRHPAVAEAAAFAIPHARLGEDVAAAVVLRPGVTVTPVELRRYLQDQVASFKVPRRIVVRDQLPKGKTGKIQRRLLTASWEDMAGTVPRIPAPPIAGTASPEDALVSGLLTSWRRLLKSPAISVDDDFFEKGGDSLLAAEMLIELETLTGKPVPSSVLFEATTIRRLAQKLSEMGDLRPMNLVKLNAEGRRPPFIYFHGNFNAFGRHAITLANILGAEQPLYVIAPHGTGDEQIPNSIEEMAADRLPLILEAQPEGPYRLGGKCLGGIIAFEVARMLAAAGKEVEMVVMLDPPTINARKSVQGLFSAMRLAQPIGVRHVEHAMAWTWFRGVQLQRFWNYPWSRRAAAISRRWEALKSKGGTQSAERREPADQDMAEESNAEMLPIGNFTDARTSRYAAAMSNYVPQPLAVRVVYVKVDFGKGAWRQISPDLEEVTSPGTHEFIDFANVAEHLKARL